MPRVDIPLTSDAPYPASRRERTRWIMAQRNNAAPTARGELDPQRPYAFLVEDERTENGEIVQVATVFLTNRECPWRCLMCDLWRNTLTESVPPGAIPAQIDYALENLPPARHIKLYNSGSFFDSLAVPVADYAAIAMRLRGFERVIVESHPALIGDNCLKLRDELKKWGDIQLEVALGLETVHPVVGPRLNKGVTLPQFAAAAARLHENGIALRVFVLIKPPFMDEAEAVLWANRSVDFAFDCGAGVVALIPTRPGNGALEALAQRGEFAPPKLATIEAAASYAIRVGRGQALVDLWDLEQFSACSQCFAARAGRLHAMNLGQALLPPVTCESCEGSHE